MTGSFFKCAWMLLRSNESFFLGCYLPLLSGTYV